MNRSQMFILVTVFAAVLGLDIYNAQIFSITDNDDFVKASIERDYANQILSHTLLITIIIILLSRNAIVLKHPGAL